MTDHTVRRRAAWCSMVVAASLLAAGCTSGKGEEATSAPPPAAASSPVPAPPASPTSSAAASPTASPTSGTSVPASDPAATTTTGPVLASREFNVKGTYTQTRVRIRFDIVELKRRGDLLDLTATLTNLEQNRDRDLRWQVGSRFSGAFRKDISDGSAFSGAILTDRAGKKRYLVAADSGNACVCTVDLSGLFVDAGQSVELSATYAAPPVSTTNLDVTVASIGTFRDLPIT